MKKYLFIFALLLAAGFSLAEDNSAVNQMHNAMVQSLANTEYYDEIYKGVPNAHGVATKENLTGEAELLRQGMGAPFVNNQGGKYLNGATPANVKNYYAHPASDPSKTVVMKSPVEVPKVGEKNPNADDIDAMMLSALGGDKAIKASQNSNYQGNYKTAVGQKEEQNFDMSDKIAAATQKQAAADKKYAALNANNNSSGEKEEPGFWGKLGKTLGQGLANTAIEFSNYKYGTNIETIGNNNNKSSGGNKNQTCRLEGVTFHGDTCTYCVNNRPRSLSDCNKCCYSFGRSLMQAPSYSATSSGGRPSGCLCRFGPTSGYRF